MRRLATEFAASERHACELMGIARTSHRYASRRDDSQLREQLLRLAREKPRFGYRRLHILLQREGAVVNHKRLQRVYRELGLSVKRTRRKRLMRMLRPQPVLSAPNQEWAIDFLSDMAASGQRLRIFSVVDSFTRECLALEVDTSLPSRRITRVLEAILAQRRRPGAIRCDNGPEITSRHFPGLVYRATDRHRAYPAGQADAEPACGELQRAAAGRVLERELVLEPIRCPAKDCWLAGGVQPAATALGAALSHAGRVCAAVVRFAFLIVRYCGDRTCVKATLRARYARP